MTFLSPSVLWCLVGVVALAGAYVVLQFRRRHHAVRFTNLDLLDSVAPRRPGWRRHVAAVGMGLALVSLVVGLARPARDERVATEQATVMLVVDVSASMEAVDVAPNRMTAAVTAAKDFVEDLPDGVQVGLVAFDRAARVVTTPTDDHDAVITGLDRLETGQGTAAGEGIYTALDALGVVEEGQPAADDDPVTAIVLLSDGTTTVGRPVEEAATAAEEESVPITTIAYGTDAGTVEVDGQTIAVPADASTMEAVAEATGGTAFVAASGDELAGIYEDIGSRIGYEVQQREIGMRFVAVGAGLLMASLLAAMAWMGRII